VETVEVDGRDLAISNGDKLFFAERGITKRQLIDYYLAVGAGALTGCFDRPSVLKRYPNGAAGPYFFQKRASVGDAASCAPPRCSSRAAAAPTCWSSTRWRR